VPNIDGASAPNVESTQLEQPVSVQVTLPEGDGGIADRDARTLIDGADSADIIPEATSLLAGIYEVHELLGKGGMGHVYRVVHRGWDMELAMKSPHPDLFARPAAREAFLREAQTWVDLGLHPHVVSCYYVRVIDGVPRLFAELVRDGSLSTHIRRGRLNEEPAHALERIIDIAIQILWGLSYAHGRELVHQDVKPANVLMTPEGIAKVTDFGLSRASQRVQTVAGIAGATTAGMTPAYCSPEQAAGHRLTPATDVWSWAVSVMEMLAGEIFWAHGQAAGHALEELTTGRTPLAIATPIPSSLIKLLRSCFEVEPARRPTDTRHLVRSLGEIYREINGASYLREAPREAAYLADSLNNRAVSMLDLGHMDRALKDWESALEANPLHLEATVNRSVFHWDQGRVDDLAVLSSLDAITETGENSAQRRGLLDRINAASGRDGAVSEVDLTDRLWRRGRIFDAHECSGTMALVDEDATPGISLIRPPWTEVFKRIEVAGVVEAACFSPGGRHLTVRSRDELTIWDVDSGTQLRCIGLGPDESTATMGMPLAVDDSGCVFLASRGDRNAVLVCFPEQDGFLPYLIGHVGDVRTLSITPDGTQIITGGSDGATWVWSAASGMGELLPTEAGASVLDVSLSPSGESLLTCHRGGTVRLWRRSSFSWEMERSFATHPDFPIAACLDEDRRLVLSLHCHPWESGEQPETMLRYREIDTGRCIRSVALGPSSLAARVYCVGDEDIHLVTNDQGGCRGWRAPVRPLPRVGYSLSLPRTSSHLLSEEDLFRGTMAEAEEALDELRPAAALALARRARDVRAFRFDPRLLALLRKIHEYGRPSRPLEGWMRWEAGRQRHGAITVVAVTEGATGVVGWESGRLEHWDPEGGFHELKGHRKKIRSLELRDGLALSGDEDDTLRVWDLEGSRCRAYLHGIGDGMRHHALVPERGEVLTSDGSRSLVIWDMDIEEVDGVMAFPDGLGTLSHLSVRSPREVILRFEDAPGLVFDLEDRRFRPTSLDVKTSDEPEGPTARTGSDGGSVEVSLPSAGAEMLVLRGHLEAVTCVDISSDGRLVASGDDGGMVRLWEVDWDLEF